MGKTGSLLPLESADRPQAALPAACPPPRAALCLVLSQVCLSAHPKIESLLCAPWAWGPGDIPWATCSTILHFCVHVPQPTRAQAFCGQSPCFTHLPIPRAMCIFSEWKPSITCNNSHSVRRKCFQGRGNGAVSPALMHWGLRDGPGRRGHQWSVRAEYQVGPFLVGQKGR